MKNFRYFRDRKHGVRTSVLYQINGFFSMKSLAQGGCRLKYHYIIRFVAFFFAVPRNRVLHNRKMRGCVAGEFRGPRERTLHPVLFADLRYLIVVGGNYYSIKNAGLFRGLYRIYNKRLFEKRFYIFLIDAL